jgi:hypothetical protein
MDDKQKQDAKQLKQTEKLTKAVMDLTKRYKTNEELAKKVGLFGGKGILGSAKEGIKNKLSDTFSLKNLGSLMGLGSGTMIGSLLESRHENKKEAVLAKKAETEKAKQFAENHAKYNPEGQALAEQSQEAAIAHGVKLYTEQRDLMIEILKVKEEIKQADETGHGDAARARLNPGLKAMQDHHAAISTGGVKPAKAKKESLAQPEESGTKVAPLAQPEEDPLVTLREALLTKGDVVNRSITQLETDNGKPMSAEEKEQLAGGIRGGMDEELLKLNKEQLEALKKLVKNSEQTEEDKLEAKKKDPILSIDKVVKTEDKKGGLFSFLSSLGPLFKGLTSGLGGLLKLIPGVSTILRLVTMIGPLLSFLASPPVLLALAGIAAAAGLLSMLSKEKTKESNGSVERFGETSTMAGALSAGTSGAEAASIMNADEAATEETGMTREERNAADQKKLIRAPWYTRMYGIGESEYLKKMETNSSNQSTLSKVEKTQREVTASRLEETVKHEQRIDEMKKAAVSEKPAAPTIVNNVSNNTTSGKSMVLAPPVRNFEPSYNSRLKTAFV